MSKICINENCNEKARYGLVNPETGMFEKHHCKIHKLDDEIGKPLKWQFRYSDILKICLNRNIKLLDSKEIFVEKTKINGKYAYINLQCLLCNYTVDTTNLGNFVNCNNFGCYCSNTIPWYRKYIEFLEICKTRNVVLLDSEEIYIENTKKKGAYTYLNLQCLNCNFIINTTTIDNFVNSGQLGCLCHKNLNWSERPNEFLELCIDNNVLLLDTIEEFIDKTEKLGNKSYPIFKCNICLDIVTTTTINSFVAGKLGCSCNKNIPYYEKYPEFLIICKNRNTELLDSEEEYIEKTKKDGVYALLKLQCLICLDIVNTTTINGFVNHYSLGCSCSNKIPWYRRYLEFLEICKTRNVVILDSEKIFIEKTKKYAAYSYITLKCLKCNSSVITTNINNFINSGQLGCKCSNSKSEECLGELLEDIFPDNKFIKIKPDWIKNKQGNSLELDFYCEYLKLAFEYQGLQHEKYVPFFHQGDINNFYKQQEHDRIKKEICEKKGIKLICVPSKYDYTNPLEMCEYILEQLN